MVRRERLALALLTLLAAALRCWRLGALALVGDEAYYWAWSRHLALSYYDHPAGVALLVRLSTLLGGQSEAGIRWLNAMLGVGAVPLAWRLSRRLVSARAAWTTAALVAVGKPFVIISRHVYPDGLLLVMLLVGLLSIDRWLSVDERPSLTLALSLGVAMALAFAAKYTAYVLAGVALLYGLLLRPRLAREPRFWLAIAVAALGLAPTLVWNAQRDWASFRWQLGHLSHGVLTPVGPWARLGNLLDYVSWPLALLAGCGVLFWRWPRARLLSVVGVALALPVLLSPANTPRSLVVVLPLLLGPGIEGLWRMAERHAMVLPLTAVLGLATLAALGGGLSAATVYRQLDERPCPWSGAVERRMALDAQGLRALAGSRLDGDETILCLDYSLAAQFTYYLGRPAVTSWPQCLEWPLPPIERVRVVSAGYLDDVCAGRALAEAYDQVSLPETLAIDKRTFHTWHAERPALPPGELLARLDLLRLAAEGCVR